MSHTPDLGTSSTGPDELEVDPAIKPARLPRWLLLLLGTLLVLLAVAGAGYAAWP